MKPLFHRKEFSIRISKNLQLHLLATSSSAVYFPVNSMAANPYAHTKQAL